ncbi:uncharacterized protein LOC129802217 [Phlebotomus papatasi]|uniref:uncharacterized protein LOC129802217 n=1 Tax=Phlebotomus papatasi TaxID=29031 RepID=UPI0024838478|nr:uncharacterized protein LOC129802217 [Phlebotomus papatasi]
MIQKSVLVISICLVGVIVAENEGNSAVDEFPSTLTTNYSSEFGPWGIVVVPPPEARLKSLEKAPPIVVPKDSVPFPTLSPSEYKRHLEVLKKFNMYRELQGEKDSHIASEGQKNIHEAPPEAEGASYIIDVEKESS